MAAPTVGSACKPDAHRPPSQSTRSRHACSSTGMLLSFPLMCTGSCSYQNDSMCGAQSSGPARPKPRHGATLSLSRWAQVVDDFAREASVCRSLNHPNIVVCNHARAVFVVSACRGGLSCLRAGDTWHLHCSTCALSDHGAPAALAVSPLAALLPLCRLGRRWPSQWAKSVGGCIDLFACTRYDLLHKHGTSLTLLQRVSLPSELITHGCGLALWSPQGHFHVCVVLVCLS
jgi:hypothetical protein